ncbi:DddA-like double-stranded DNA deaminase toxin [Actinosynnema sp. CS-041913]|uniref:DddA-like double-stranded DNA deaminase toxin n=1 Tax=Actinosynnema sp. CS-041913 TaxID=3239917 RepID=UPI003D8B2F71
MASVGDVAAGVRAACEKGGQARTALEQAEDLAQEAHAMLARALEGAHHLEADAAQVLAAFTGMVDACKGYLWPLLNEAVKGAESYADRLAAESTPAPAPTSQRPAQPPQQPPTAQPQQPPARQSEAADPPTMPRERVEAIRRTLPPPVVTGSGQKTVGQWINSADGTAEPVTSGFDQRSALVQSQLARMGLSAGTRRSGDVEMKVAAYMVANGIRHAEVVVNNTPCLRHEVACVKWISRMEVR